MIIWLVVDKLPLPRDSCSNYYDWSVNKTNWNSQCIWITEIMLQMRSTGNQGCFTYTYAKKSHWSFELYPDTWRELNYRTPRKMLEVRSSETHIILWLCWIFTENSNWGYCFTIYDIWDCDLPCLYSFFNNASNCKYLSIFGSGLKDCQYENNSPSHVSVAQLSFESEASPGLQFPATVTSWNITFFHRLFRISLESDSSKVISTWNEDVDDPVLLFMYKRNQ